MILLISDFDLKGSGYMNIAVSLSNELAKQGRDVTALGIGYDMGEHNWPFTIIPVNHGEMTRQIAAMIHNFRGLAQAGEWKQIEAIIVALDIPLQERLLGIDRGSIPYIGIFPVESGPLCPSWAASISLMNEALVISEFGAKMVKEQGIKATYLPVGIDCKSWRPPTDDERRGIRKSLGFKEDDFVVLTVADNQERKNLSAGMEAVARARAKINAKWVLVSRLMSPVGWKLNDLAAQFGMTDHFLAFDRGLPFDRLWILYAAADAFLLTSKAEGLCLPILEAMATKVPVVATNCTAIPEHIYADPDWDRIVNGSWRKEGKPKGDRGIVIPVEYETNDPWGNSIRSFVNIQETANILVKLAKGRYDVERIKNLGMAYAQSRTWEEAGEVLNGAVHRAIVNSVQSPAQVQQAQAGLPASVPRPLPPMYGIPDQGKVEE